VDSDFDLLDRWRAGDRPAGEALLARHFDALCGFFESKVGDDADDLVQRTMLACVAAKDRFRKEASFRTYLYTVARHELYHHLRRRQRDGQRLDFSVSSIAEILTTPGSKLVKRAERQRVVEALRQLPVEQQVLLELYYWQELDIAALCEVLDVEIGTARVRLHRARARLRAVLEADGAGQAIESLGGSDADDKLARDR